MNVEWAKLLLAPFIYLAAIALAVFLAWLSRKPIRRLLDELHINTLKVLGIELSMSTKELDNARVEVSKNMKKAGFGGLIEKYDKNAAKELILLAELASPYTLARRILWVDDHPLNNSNERRAFRLLGIEVVNRLNTPEAIVELNRDDYDIVISDITRFNDKNNISYSDPCAGWNMLSEINSKFRVPVIFYHGTYDKDEERDKDALKKGAVGATIYPTTLYRWVLSILFIKTVRDDDKLRPLLLVIPGEIRQRISAFA